MFRHRIADTTFKYTLYFVNTTIFHECVLSESENRCILIRLLYLMSFYYKNAHYLVPLCNLFWDVVG